MSGTTNIPAVCVLIRRGDTVLFVKRAHTGFQDGYYCLPAGHVERGESFRMAAVRETFEEVGLQLRPDTLRHVHTQHNYQGDDNIWVHLFFEADDWHGEPYNAEPEKHDEIAWLPIEALPHDVITPFVADALEHIAKQRSYAEFGWKGDRI